MIMPFYETKEKTETHREGHMKMEVEDGVVGPEAKERLGWKTQEMSLPEKAATLI